VTLTEAPIKQRPSTRGDAASRWSFESRRRLAERLFVDLALIAVGATTVVQIMGYTLTLLTPICLLLAPALLLSKPTRGQLIPLAVAILGFSAFVVSAFVNDLAVGQFSSLITTDQRVIQPLAFAIYYVGLFVLSGRDLERIFSLLAGIAIGSIGYITNAGYPGAVMNTFESLWKYAWAPWATILILYLLAQLRVKLPVQATALFLLGGFSFSTNYRSHAIVCVATGAILLIGAMSGGSMARWFQLTVVGGFAAFIYVLVPRIALSGIAGEAVREKTELQQDAGVPMILAGRTESPLSLAAIWERPWFGWGTADNIDPAVFEHAKSLAISFGFDPSVPFEANWYLPNGSVSLHSILLSAWAEGGILAALLPITLLVFAVCVIWNASRYGRWAAVAVVVAVQATWDLLFSPTSYNMIPVLAVLAVVFVARHLPPKHSEAEPDTAPAVNT
jgi:hypothetical protein